MVWAGFCGPNISQLVEIEKEKGKGFNATKYIEQVLEPVVLPWYNTLKGIGRRPIFMQDGSSIHNSKEAKLWLRQYQIETLEWPPNSPDLNPQEHVWRAMKQHIKRQDRLVLTEKGLCEAVREAYKHESRRTGFMKYVESMPERVKDVIKNRGFSTKW